VSGYARDVQPKGEAKAPTPQALTIPDMPGSRRHSRARLSLGIGSGQGFSLVRCHWFKQIYRKTYQMPGKFGFDLATESWKNG
jgi:hypothetical protein